jgi:hypothetical protein
VAFTPASTAQPVKAVLFDVFGTVVGWRTGVAAAAAFISRPLEQGPRIPGAGVATKPWDLSVSSTTELADLT